MATLTVCSTLAVLTSASPAAAARSYGGYDDRARELVTVQLADSALELRAATMRVVLDCEDSAFSWVPVSARVVRKQPRPGIRNHTYFVHRPSRGRALRYRLWGRLGSARRYTQETGSLTVTRVRAGTARVHFAVRIRNNTRPRDPCSRTTSLTLRRSPGVLYAGMTDDDEPVLIRRLGESVEWLSGFGTNCRPFGFMQGIHENALMLRDGAEFGWPGLIDGFSLGEFGDRYTQAVQIAGALGDRRANGTLRIVGRGGPDDARRCDTGMRSWVAFAG